MTEQVADEIISVADLSAGLASGAIWILSPQAGGWPILIALLPKLVQGIRGKLTLPRAWLDLGIGVFLVTAWIGSRVAYDSAAALNKFWVILAAVVLHYAIASQPRSRALWFSGAWFLLGVAAAGYFFMAHDFIAEPRKLEWINTLGAWWMKVRPAWGLPAVHPNYLSGLAMLGALMGILLLWKVMRSEGRLFKGGALVFGYGLIFLALVAGTSRGAWMALVGAAGVGVCWAALQGWRKSHPRLFRKLFPAAVLLYLVIFIGIIFVGPAQAGDDLGGQSPYGSGSRAELLQRSLSLVGDFPITGGGLGSFPGLYSHYILSIPYFYLSNSHNQFLDVAIEQGLIGGVAFAWLYLASIWMASRTLADEMDPERRIFVGLLLLSLCFVMIHAQVEDYLYNGKGAILALVLVSLAVWAHHTRPAWQHKIEGKGRRNKNTAGYWRLDSPVFLFGLAAVSALGVILVRWNDLRAVWYANRGAVTMARYDLADFPNRGWDAGKDIAALLPAMQDFEKALELDPYNLTANHRLGLIAMLQRDFGAACAYLEVAHQLHPAHRGIIKNLGYCYIWEGELERGQKLLRDIPEAHDELDVYVWWWAEQGQPDLSERASRAAAALALGH